VAKLEKDFDAIEALVEENGVWVGRPDHFCAVRLKQCMRLVSPS